MKTHAPQQRQPQQQEKSRRHGLLRQPAARFPAAPVSTADGPEPARGTPAITRFAHDFSRIAVHTKTPPTIQTKFTVNAPGDAYEQEADRAASQVMRANGPAGQAGRVARDHLQTRRARANASHEITAPPAVHEALRSSGRPLDPNTRQFMESRFGFDFGHVRTHADAEAAGACGSLRAQAFTHGPHIYFGAGKSPGPDELTAHELTHVVQQTAGPQDGRAPSIQRKLELRPPGKGEASAFPRAQELIDRLNTVSPAIQYKLVGRLIEYEVKDEAALTFFDKKMKDFIDRAPLIPMRLITSKGYLGGRPLFADDFTTGYVDLDDLMADDIYSFQSDLLHFLTERFQVKDYERLIGTDFTAKFDKAHKAGKDAEAEQLQFLFNDPSVVFVYEDKNAKGTWVNAFKSKDHGYWVFQVVKKSEREVAGGEMWVKKKDGSRVSMDDFRKERAAAAKP